MGVESDPTSKSALLTVSLNAGTIILTRRAREKMVTLRDIVKDLKLLARETLRPIRFFSDEEYANRLSKVRARMSSQDLDLLLITNTENIRYLTGVHTFGKADQFLLLPLEGEMIQVQRFLESFLSKVYSVLPDDHIVIYEDIDNPFDIVANTIKEMGLASARIGLEGLCTSVAVKEQLMMAGRETLSRATWVRGKEIVERVRDIKSQAELDYIRKAGKLSVQGVHAGLAAVKADTTDNAVSAAAATKLVSLGSEPLRRSPIVTSGWRSGVPHTTFERQRIEVGDTVLLELSGVYGGYVAPIMRTAVVGEPNAKLREMEAVVLEGLQAALDVLKPGVTSGDVDAACRTIIEKAGYYDNFRKRTGYSVGLGRNEALSLSKENPRMLQAGMVFHLPVALRSYGKAVVGLSTTVALTEEGIEVLTEIPEGLTVK